MSSVSAFEAKTNFGSILDRVADGKEIVVTRHDKPVARIVAEGAASRDNIRESVTGLRALLTRLAARTGFRPLTDAAIKAAINNGRR